MFLSHMIEQVVPSFALAGVGKSVLAEWAAGI
jgi:hypothetical protein